MIRRLAKKVFGKLRNEGPSTPAPRAAPPAGTTSADAMLEGEDMATIDAGCQEVKERIDCGEPVVLLDVRQPEETAQGVIPGAICIPLPELEARWHEVKDCDEVVCYCAAGGRSLKAATFLRNNGVFNATSLEGGIGEWMRIGGEVGPASNG